MMIDVISEQKKRVQIFVRKHGRIKGWLARRAGLPAARLTGVESENWNPLVSTLAALIRAIDSAEQEERMGLEVIPREKQKKVKKPRLSEERATV